ncbi:MAG: TauD/TfdA family dioxygenase, partial [Myxococcota bacterium]
MLGEALRVHPLLAPDERPVVVTGDGALPARLRERRDEVDALLADAGAVLFRGFAVDEPGFADVVDALCVPAPYVYRSTPRTGLGRGVHTATEYPAHQEIPLHCENAYQRRWPERLVLMCAQPAEAGGETPIADVARVTDALDPALVERFARRKVQYERTNRPGVDLPWQTVFQTDDTRPCPVLRRPRHRARLARLETLQTCGSATPCSRPRTPPLVQPGPPVPPLGAARARPRVAARAVPARRPAARRALRRRRRPRPRRPRPGARRVRQPGADVHLAPRRRAAARQPRVRPRPPAVPGRAARAGRHGRRAGAVRAALPLALLSAVLCFLPALGGGFFGDDYVFLASLAGSPPCTCRPFDLDAYASGDPREIAALVQSGTFPWWTAPDLKIALFRPLASALLQLDHALFGTWAAGYHAHSLLWFLALIAALGAVLRRVLPPGLAAVAVVVFAVDQSHWYTVSWISNRHALVSAVAAMAMLWAHLRWRREGWRPGLPLSLLAQGAALAAGEGGLSALGFVVAYELAGAEDGPRARLRAVLPSLGVAAGYLALYGALGYGAHGAGAFVDPLSEPLRFVARAAVIAPAMLAELSLATEVLYDVHRPGLLGVAIVTVGAVGLVGWGFHRALRPLAPEAARGC